MSKLELVIESIKEWTVMFNHSLITLDELNKRLADLRSNYASLC